jgi:hypothetical protein
MYCRQTELAGAEVEMVELENRDKRLRNAMRRSIKTTISY